MIKSEIDRVLKQWIGLVVTLAILFGVGVIIYLNLETSDTNPKREVSKSKSSAGNRPSESKADRPASAIPPAGFREHPIGDEVERNGIRIAAVWLPPLSVEGMTEVGGGASDVIHLEADVHATEANPNGFAKDEFVPYLKIRYKITRGDEHGETIDEGPMTPMIARDGLHYGANLALPGAGRYRLTYRIEPPSAGGLGRHTDPFIGVAPWWKPFDVSFDWDFDGLSRDRVAKDR